MGTNEGWPEAFGFSLAGGCPVMIDEVEEGGSAQQAGLQVGDFLIEINGEKVEDWGKDEVIELAQQSLKVPPSLAVMSKIREVILQKNKDGGFGVTFRGNSPVFIRSVDFDSAARAAGLRSGDLLVELNNKNVRYSMKMEVLELLKASKEKLRLKVVAGGLPRSSTSHRVKKQKRGGEKRVSQEILSARYEKARLFHSKVDYYLMGETMKKTHLMTLLRLYSKDKDINSLGASLNILLDTPTQRRLCYDIRTFVHASHHDRFDTLVLFDPNRSLPRKNHHRDQWRGSLQWNRPLGAEERKSHMRASMPDLSYPNGRTIQIHRGSGSFGLALNGNAPVFIRSVDKGGPSERAGLRPGDQLLQLNGINIRGATHSQVVQMLRMSGPRPTLVVASATDPYIGLGYGTFSQPSDAQGLVTETRRSVGAFKDKMGEVLNPEEKQLVMKQLTKFSKHKEIPELVNSLSWILDSPAKTVLYHYICQLLPDEAQREFDRTAAAVLAGESAATVSTSSGPLNGNAVPHQRLRLSSSSSSLSSTHSHDNERESGAAAAVGIGQHLDLMRQSSGESYTESRHYEGSSRRASGGKDRGRRIRWSEEENSLATRANSSNIGSKGINGTGELNLERDDFGDRIGKRGSNKGGRGSSTGDGGSNFMETDKEKEVDGKRDEKKKSPMRQTSKEKAKVTPISSQSPLTPTQTPNTTVMSTPGAVPLPPNPPPTPATGVGGVPIPPPPPPTFSAETQSNLKRVNWEKISGAEGTIWKELSGLEEALEYFEIEEKFANQAPKTGATKKSSKTSILNERKAYNIAILLGHLKLPFDSIKEAVLACDESVLSEQHLRQMEAFAPDQKECLGFARFHGDPSVLSKADRFACEMSTITGYKQRLRAMIFKIHFKEKVDEIKPDLEAILKASGELQSSKNLKRVLEIVLAVGNYMNAGNRRVGKAIGFRIKYLTQLKDLKTTDNKSSLLHFVAATVERKFPQVLEFSEDLTHVPIAARVSGETLEVEVNELAKGLQDIQKTIDELSQTENPEDKFCGVMTKFISWADKEMTELLKAFSLMKQEFYSVMKFYGEDTAKTRIDDFFSTFASFISDFERAVAENREAREKQAMLELKAKEKEQVIKKKGGFRLFSRSSKNMEEEMKRELRAKSSKAIDVKSLEESRQTRIKDGSGQQQDFRHLLKKTNPSTQNSQQTRTSDAKEREPESKKEKRKIRSRQSSTETDVVPTKQESRKTKSAREKDKGKHTQKAKAVENKNKSGLKLSSSAAELTGSWDYIPSAPTSTVQLSPAEEDVEAENDYETEEIGDSYPDDAQQGAWNDVDQILSQVKSGLDDDGFNYDDDGFNYDDDGGLGDFMSSSPPLLDLQQQPMSGNKVAMTAQKQDFDFETHF